MQPDNQDTSEKLLTLYDLMERRWGNRGWWPASTIDEIIIGAILVQNVSWANVERAIIKLKTVNLVDFSLLLTADEEDIGECIRSTRFFKSKTKKLLAFARYLEQHYAGNIGELLDQPTEPLRSELLNIYGIGPETADDIILYAAGKPTFVIDTYTRRIFSRLTMLSPDVPYETMRQWFLSRLPKSVPLLNQYHALLDAVGHHHCLPKQPHCSDCPLLPACPYGRNRTALQEREQL